MAHYFQQVLKMNIDEINGQYWQVLNKWCKNKTKYDNLKNIFKTHNEIYYIWKKTLTVRNKTKQMNKKSLNFCINKWSITWVLFIYSALSSRGWVIDIFVPPFCILSDDGLFSHGSNCPLLNNVTPVHPLGLGL